MLPLCKSGVTAGWNDVKWDHGVWTLNNWQTFKGKGMNPQGKSMALTEEIQLILVKQTE